MAHVSVTIAGRVYRLACADGEEKHLEELARRVDMKAAEIKGAFGEIGDQRVTVMVALQFADELNEAGRALAEAKDNLTRVRSGRETWETDNVAQTEHLSRSLHDAAERIERLSQQLNRGAAE